MNYIYEIIYNKFGIVEDRAFTIEGQDELYCFNSKGNLLYYNSKTKRWEKTRLDYNSPELAEATLTMTPTEKEIRGTFYWGASDYKTFEEVKVALQNLGITFEIAASPVERKF